MRRTLEQGARRSFRHVPRRGRVVVAPGRMRLPSRSSIEGFVLGLGLVLAALVWTWLSWAK